MTQLRSHKQDRTALRLYLQKAGEVGIKSYVDMVVGALAVRAAASPSRVDDVVVILLQVLVDRVFPPPKPEPASPVQADEH